MLMVLAASVVGSFGAVFLKSGAKRLHDGLRYLIFNPHLIAGVFLFLVSSVFYMAGIKRGELSVLYPMVSLANIWTMFWSRLFFKEPFTQQKIAGLGLILLGVVFVGIGSS